MRNSNRDNFSKTTADILAKRVAYKCSSPICRKFTIGPNSNPNKATSIGVAAHISAASAGGPRYETSYSKFRRKDISNGIWLCSNCAALIDKDVEKYSIDLLHEWKVGAEEASNLVIDRVEVNDNDVVKKIKAPTLSPILEADLLGGGRSRSPRGMSNKNPVEMHDGQLVIVAGLKPIIHWAMSWRYKLVIYNNSNYPAFNVSIENFGEEHFSESEKLNVINNIAPLNNIELKVRFDDYVEADHTIPDKIMKSRFPEKFKALKLKLVFYDEMRNLHYSYVEFNENFVLNRR